MRDGPPSDHPGQVIAPARATHTAAEAASWLSPMVVDGRNVPAPVALQMLKNALHRSWSSDPKDRDVVVCRTPVMTGSHLHTLRCETNREYFRTMRKTQMGLLTGGGLPANEDGWSTSHRVNAAALRHLLNKLPPATSSYTLQVKDHGRVEAEYVFKKGRLVKTWKRSKHGG